MQKFITLGIRSIHQQKFLFSDSWKERDEAAEKVYITKT